MENKGKTKMTFSEKRASSAQEKLANLREKISNNPPKTIMGKELVKARLNRLQNIVDRRILKNNIKVAQDVEQYQEYEEYYNAQEKLMSGVSELQFEKENVLRQLQKLERFNPDSNEFMYVQQQRKVSKNMPKGYKPKENKNEASKIRSNVEEQRNKLEERLKQIEDMIVEYEKTLEKNNQGYKESRKEIKDKYKQELALVAPGPFTRIKNFIVKKVNQFKQWRENKKIKAQEELLDAVDKTEEASKRELFLKANAANISPKKQAELSQQIQGELNKKTQETQIKNEKVEIEHEGSEIE